MRRALAALLLVSAVGPALGEEPAPAAPAEPPAEPAAAPVTDPRYWSGQRHVGVVQKRRFPKSGGLELAFFTGIIPNDAFVLHLPAGARLTLHRSEHFAWEVSASATLDVDTALRDFLEEEDANLSAQVRDRQRARLDVGVVWSPIYGKFAWMNRKVLHVDVFFSAALGAVYTTAEYLDGAEGIRPEAMLGLGTRVFLSRGLSLRLEVRQLGYLRADDPSGEAGGLATPTEISLGLGLLFGGGR